MSVSEQEVAQAAVGAYMSVLGMCAGELSAVVGADGARSLFRSVVDNDAFWAALPAIRQGSIIGASEAIAHTRKDEEA